MSAVASPCTGLCTYDPRRAACLGCGRTLADIADWTAADDARRREIVADAACRRRGWSDIRAGD